ncbi:unnamed protein product [Rhodiola kirilowii]
MCSVLHLKSVFQVRPNPENLAFSFIKKLKRKIGYSKSLFLSLSARHFLKLRFVCAVIGFIFTLYHSGRLTGEEIIPV